jgi:hypothetical protein
MLSQTGNKKKHFISINSNVVFISFFTLVVVSFYLYSCNKEKIDAPEPLKNKIAKATNCTCDPYVDKYLWRNKETYIWTCGGPACDCIVTYYDEKGNVLTMDSTFTFDEFRHESQFIKHVWSCKE